jgi:hypothetical protein
MHEEILEVITKDDYLYSYTDEHLFISIFSSKEYEVNDYEITTKVQRDYLAKKLTPLLFKWTRGNELSSPELNEKVVFPKFRYRELYPKKEIESLSNDIVIVLTPTLLAIHLIFSLKNPEEELLNLINKQPINYTKLIKLLPEKRELLKRIGIEQEELLMKSPLKYRHELDTTF